MAYATMAQSPRGFNNPSYIAIIKDRISERLVVTQTGCRECHKGIGYKGYSNIWFDNRMWVTHRLLWILERGDLSPDLTLDHLCRNRKCCNLDHLEPVTMLENWRRGEGLNALKRATMSRSKRAHCRRGHRYVATDFTPDGRRRCFECKRATNKAAYEKAVKAGTRLPRKQYDRPPWHAWYRTVRWRQIRAEQLRREPLCAMCNVSAATICDHTIPHKGNEIVFWEGPLQSLCKGCHDSAKQRLEKGGPSRCATLSPHPVGVALDAHGATPLQLIQAA